MYQRRGRPRVESQGQTLLWRVRRSKSIWVVIGILGVLSLHLHRRLLAYSAELLFPVSPRTQAQRNSVLERCKYITTPAGPPPGFHARSGSDRLEPGTKPVLLTNAKIWTGERNGTEVVYGDILLDRGLIKSVGYVPPQLIQSLKEAGEEVQVVDVQSAWITPGLVDLHSHLGVGPSPHLSGASDGNSRKAPILPWLRSIDGLNTHDDSYALAVAGGVTTAQILPGSANNIGGQAFVIKLRRTAERSPTSMVLEPPWSLNGTNHNHHLTPRWRHMKHACGENPSRVYSQTRMDSAWAFRGAYDAARKLKQRQDEFCSKAKAGRWDELDEPTKFPEDLQWEALVDVLRGKVKLSIHCYEAVDLDAIIRLSNEFEFPVASFHHAGETYLVPNLLKKAWGGIPSIALFASNFRKKREAYRGSEFAPRILAEHKIPVVMKSDHPVVNSRYLLFEAAQAHYHGLHPALALASVTSTPADTMGMGHRIGKIKEGNDADVVVWDAHPLALSATPKQVFIDGIPQLDQPSISAKPLSFQEVPETPNFDIEAKETVEYEGLPPLAPRARLSGPVIFTNVKNVFVKEGGEINVDAGANGRLRSVLIENGTIACIGLRSSCFSSSADHEKAEYIDLAGGALVPGLTTFGAPLGLVEIRLEASTNDGNVFDLLAGGKPAIISGNATVVRAVDGLQFGGRNTLLAYRAGVTKAITPPTGLGFLLGLSTAFSTGSMNALERGSITHEEVALHVRVSKSLAPSVSTQIAALRHLLFSEPSAGVGDSNHSALLRAKKGEIPLVVHVESADVMATLLNLKEDYEVRTGASLRLTFVGAAEAHLIAREIASAGVSVIVTPSRPFPFTWDQRRILPGPPLSNESAIVTLTKHGVNVAVGVVDEYAARNTRFDIAWAALESHGLVGEAHAIAMATTNLERALGVESRLLDDIVAYRGGGMLDFQSKVVGVISATRRVVDVF